MRRYHPYYIVCFAIAFIAMCLGCSDFIDPQQQAHDLFEQSKQYNKEKDVERQVTTLMQAYQLLPQINDPILASQICQALGNAYMYRDLYDESLAYSREAINYALQEEPHGKQLSLAYSQLGRTFAELHQTDSAFVYFEKALEQAQLLQDTTEIAVGYGQLSVAYRVSKDYSKALEYAKHELDIYIQHGDSSYIPQAYYSIGATHYYLGQLDSAKVCFEKALNTKNLYTIQGSYQALYHINRKLGNLAEAIEYNQLNNTIKDSIANMARDEMLAEMQVKYDNEKLLSEQSQQKLHNSYLLIALILLATTSLAFIAIYQYRLKRNEHELQNAFLKLQDNNQTIWHNRQQINQITQELKDSEQMAATQIQDLNNHLADIQSSNEHLQEYNQKLEKIISQREKYADQTINRMMEQNKHLQKQNDSLLQFFEQHFPELKELHNNPHPIKDWQSFYTLTDTLYNLFYSRLKQDMPDMPEYSLQICCLVKHSFSTPQIARIVGIAANSLSKQKGRIRNSMVEHRPDLFQERLTLDELLSNY